MNVAGIDIGTNSVRLLLARWENGTLVRVDKKLETTRLGEGTAARDELGAEPMRRTARAVATFAGEARAAGCRLAGVYATSAVREAPNRRDFTALCAALSGAQVDVLSGWQESLCAFLGAARAEDALAAVADIGGGSTEISFGRFGALEAAGSARVGAVRMRERFARPDGELSPAARRALHDDARAALDPLARAVPRGATLTGVGGTFTSLAAMALGLARYEADAVQDCVLARDEIDRMCGELCASSLERRLAMPGLMPKRADIMPAACVIALAAMDACGAGRVRVSERDGLEGYVAMKLAGRLA